MPGAITFACMLMLVGAAVLVGCLWGER